MQAISLAENLSSAAEDNKEESWQAQLERKVEKEMERLQEVLGAEEMELLLGRQRSQQEVPLREQLPRRRLEPRSL
jgi:hypothetical protein